MSPLNIMPFFIARLCLVSLKSISAIEQLIHIFLFILSDIWLNTSSSLLSIVCRFTGKMTISTQDSLLYTSFSGFSSFSFINSSLDRTSAYSLVFSFT